MSITAMFALTGLARAQTTSAATTSPAASTTEQPVALPEFEVQGYRGSLELSLETKRNANAIVDVISAEDIGKFPDTNVAESLSHLPGVTVDRLFGEGERVSVNGTDPNLSRTLLNGEAIASGDWFILDAPSRQFNYTLLAPESIGQAEVYKSPEARLPEGSIGATIILHTRDPLAQKSGLSFAATGGINYNDRAKNYGDRFSQVISWRNPGDTFGVLLGLQSSREHFRRDGVEALGFVTLKAQNATPPAGSLNATSPNAVEPNAINIPLFDQTRIRTGGNLAITIKPSDKLIVEFNALSSKQKDDNANYSYYPFPGWGGGGVTTTGTVVGGVVDSGTVTNNIAVEDLFDRQATVKTESYDVKITEKGDSWTVSEHGGYTKATGGTQHQFYIEPAVGAGFSFTQAKNNPGFSWSDPTLATTPQKWTLGGAWWNGNLASDPETDDEKYAQIDGDYKVNENNKLLAGVRYTDHNTAQNWYILTVNTLPFTDLTAFGGHLTPGNFGQGLPNFTTDMKTHVIVDPAIVGRIVSNLPYLPPGVSLPASYYSGPIGGSAVASNGVSSSQLMTMQQALDSGQGFQPTQSFSLAEQTYAAYLQDDFTYGVWTGNVGVRYVRTRTTSTGAQVNTLDAAGNTQTIPLTFDHYYDNFLPAVNVNYSLAKDQNIRGAISQVISRPNYADESPSLNLFNSILQGNGGNPNLKPYKSTDLDLSYEWYFAKNAILQVNPFYKKITDYVYGLAGPEQQFNQALATPGLSTFNIVRPRNASSATVKGASVYVQADIYDGFGATASYTYTNANGSNNIPLPYTSKHQVNISPYFEKWGFLARLTYAWRSDYFKIIDRGAQDYAKAYTELDLNLAYNITKNIQVSFAATNLLDETYYFYAKNVPGVTGNLFQGEYKNGRRYEGAVHVNF